MCNKAFEILSGYGKVELLGQKPQIINPTNDNEEFYEMLWLTLKTAGSWEGELCYRQKDRTLIPIWLSFNAICDPSGTVTHYVGAFSDLTVQKDMENQLEKMAFYDGLTGLPNRALFYIYLRKAVARVKQTNTKIAVLFIDLDGFKLVNDTFGHSNGDMLLIEVGNRISQNIRETDLLSRWGGDEFTMILENIREKADVEKSVSDLLYNISREITISGEWISIGASIGIAIFPDVGDSIEEIMINADKAMYTSKANGKNCFTFTTGMINTLGQWVIDEACQTIREMEALGIWIPVSINVSVSRWKNLILSIYVWVNESWKQWQSDGRFISVQVDSQKIIIKNRGVTEYD